MLYPADTHTHSNFSVDARDSIGQMALTALAKGIKYLTCTDHLEHNQSDEGYGFWDAEKYDFEIKRISKLFGKQVRILKGIEFSEPHYYPEALCKLAEENFDVIIGGIHYIGNLGCHYFDPAYPKFKPLIQDYDARRCFEEYYQEVLQSVQQGGFQVLAHFDNPKRYLRENFPDWPIVDQIMSEMVKNDIALEINTSPYRKGFNEPSPGFDTVKKYLRAGGKKITLGSDAHRKEDIAADFERAGKFLSSLGVVPGLFIKQKFYLIDQL